MVGSLKFIHFGSIRKQSVANCKGKVVYGSGCEKVESKFDSKVNRGQRSERKLRNASGLKDAHILQRNVKISVCC